MRMVSSALALGLAALVAFVPLPEVDDSAEPPPPPQELQNALDAVDSGEAEAEAEAIAGEDGLVAAGTPCFMRHKRMALGVDRDFRHRFAAATLATDPGQKEAILAAIVAEAPSAAAVWRVAMARAELALRDGRLDAAAAHLATASQADMPDWCRADEHFLNAALSRNTARAAEHLDAAVAADPGFWAAQERLALIAAGGTGSDADACGRDAARTIRTTIQLGSLATSDGQFARLERALLGLEDNGRTALLRGMILRETGRTEDALALWESALTTLGPSACDQMLDLALQRMIANTVEDTP